jgi:hypothetical protein
MNPAAFYRQDKRAFIAAIEIPSREAHRASVVRDMIRKRNGIMGTQSTTRSADSRALATIGVTLGAAALFATSIAAFLVAVEIQSPGISWQAAQQVALETSRQ